MRPLKTLRDIDVSDKTILYCAPYDIGVENVNGILTVKDDSRIRATLPTLHHLLQHNCKIVVLTFVERPNGVDETLRTIPHAKKLQELLGHTVKHIDSCIGETVDGAIARMKPQDILMLENVRFYPEEAANDDTFSQELIKGKDHIVFDGFPQAHRDEASTTGVLRHLPSVTGFYFEQEYTALSQIMEHAEHPLVFIIGGVKAETKIPVINSFLTKADAILIGGSLPNDPLIEPYTHNPIVHIASLSENGKDITQESISHFLSVVQTARTIICAGPLGAFEEVGNEVGTKTIFSAVAHNPGYTLGAGGDTIDAIDQFGLRNKFRAISLAGGATLEFLAGKDLAVLQYLLKE